MARYVMIAVVGPSAVRCPDCPFPVIISETKQDRLIVTMEHYIEVGTADSVAAFRSSAGAWMDGWVDGWTDGWIFWFQIRNINTAVCSILSSDHSCCQQSSTVARPQVLSTVVIQMRPSESVVNNHRRLRWQHLWCDQSRTRGEPASFRSGNILLMRKKTCKWNKFIQFVTDCLKGTNHLCQPPILEWLRI